MVLYTVASRERRETHLVMYMTRDGHFFLPALTPEVDKNTQPDGASSAVHASVELEARDLCRKTDISERQWKMSAADPLQIDRHLLEGN